MRESVFEGDTKQCYGCRACEQICPVSAITMAESIEGFLFPNLDSTSCIECHNCEDVCPVIPHNLRKISYAVSNRVYASWNSNKAQLMKSTSGAIFPLLSKEILNENGIIYGCSWNKDKMFAEHIRVDSGSGLERLKGSRYVQSDIKNTFQQAKNDLDDGKNVLFSGTPCQIAGLRLFLGKDYNNLLAVDLVCHGVPSPKLFNSYMDHLQIVERQSIANFKFRDKKKSGWVSWVSWEDPTKFRKKTYRASGADPYLFGFSSGYFNRESCYLCKFSAPKRVGDVTLGDYWGIDTVHPELKGKHKYGISVVICNSEKGKAFFENIDKDIVKIESSFKKASINNQNLLRPLFRPPIRSWIYKKIEEKGFSMVATNILRNRYYYFYRYLPEHIQIFLHLTKKEIL